MPELRLVDGRIINARRISDQQLALDLDFAASRERPAIIEVVAIDGEDVAPTRLAVLDTHSIWLSHQAEIAPRSNSKPAVRTGLFAPEGRSARELFQRLVGVTLPSLQTAIVAPREQPRASLVEAGPVAQPGPELDSPNPTSLASTSKPGGRLHTVKLVLEIVAVLVTVIGGIIGIIAVVWGWK